MSDLSSLLGPKLLGSLRALISSYVDSHGHRTVLPGDVS